jgi:hypothetical protein
MFGSSWWRAGEREGGAAAFIAAPPWEGGGDLPSLAFLLVRVARLLRGMRR